MSMAFGDGPQHDKQNDKHDQNPTYRQFVPPGHFYSPIPDLNEVEKYRSRLFDDRRREMGEVDLQEAEQLQMLDKMEQLYHELPFPEQKAPSFRYYYKNPAFQYGDAITLYALMRLIKPHQYVEAGSGYSSCVALDTDETFLGGQTKFTFIEPYPDNVLSLIKKEDRKKITILPKNLQDVDVDYFSQLESEDFLFFDTTHVCKAGSDVQYIFFEILPLLKSGIYIHFHDIFFPFEYPEEWILEGRAWNELYILHAFLQNNTKYEIVYFNNYMGKMHYELIGSKLPKALNNVGGSIWLKKK